MTQFFLINKTVATKSHQEENAELIAGYIRFDFFPINWLVRQFLWHIIDIQTLSHFARMVISFNVRAVNFHIFEEVMFNSA